MPTDMTKYPKGWKTEIRPSILRRAGGSGDDPRVGARCEICGVRNYDLRKTTEDNAWNEGLYGSWAQARAAQQFMKSNYQEHYSIIVLTIAHLDHDPANCDESNLLALCQRCHNRMDAQFRADRRRRYKVVLVDPPWNFRNKTVRGGAFNWYKTMPVEEIMAMPIPRHTTDESVVLLWGVWSRVRAALEVMDAWGFEQISGFPWVKTLEPPYLDGDGILRARLAYGTGWWVRGGSEFVLIGKKKNAKAPRSNFLGLLAPRLEHSRKPDDIYHYIEESFSGPYLELFARRNRDGWHSYGDAEGLRSVYL